MDWHRTLWSVYRLGSAAALIMAALVLPPGTCRGEDQSSRGSGLEVDQYRYLRVEVEDLGPAAQRIGLTRDAILNRVELRLRAAGIKPAAIPGRDDYLYVNLNTVGTAFSVHVELKRIVTYSAGDRKLHSFASTWTTGSAGTHGYDPAYLVNALDPSLDKFLNAYLRANQQ